jgi:transposase
MTKTFRLTEPQLKELNEYERVARGLQVFKRLTAIRMKHNGLNNTEIAKALNISRVSVGRWIKAFEVNTWGGLVRDNYKRKRSKLGLPEWIEIKEAHQEWPFKNSLHLKHHVESKYNLSFNKNYLKQRARDKYGIRFKSMAPPTS